MGGFIYWGVLRLRISAEQAGLLDVFAPLYYITGFSLMATSASVYGARALLWSVLQDDERNSWLPSLLTHSDFAVYSGLRSLLRGFIWFILTYAVPFLMVTGVVWRPGLPALVPHGVLTLLVGLSFCIVGSLLMSLLVALIPPKKQRGILLGITGLAAVLMVAVALYFNYVWVADGETLPADMGELLYLVYDELQLVSESLKRFLWPASIAVALVGGMALRKVWPVTYRLDKGTVKRPVTNAFGPVSRETRLATLVGRLPVDHVTRSFLKKDMLLYLRNHRALVETLGSIGITLVAGISAEEPMGFLVMLYFYATMSVSFFLRPSLVAEGSNIDYVKMLAEKGRFIVAKVVSTFIVTLFLSLISLVLAHGFAPALQWDWGTITLRIVILGLVVLLASAIGMVFGEEMLMTGQESMDRNLLYYCAGLILASGWMSIDLFLTDPQMLPTWAGALLPHVPLVVFGSLTAYCVLRLKTISRAIEDI